MGQEEKQKEIMLEERMLHSMVADRLTKKFYLSFIQHCFLHASHCIGG